MESRYRFNISPISRLSEYVAAVEELTAAWDTRPPRTLWYRGQSSSKYELIPSTFRGRYGALFERNMTRDFRLMAPTLLDRVPTSELSWLFLMQHYGLPTRLLDWTGSHLVALYFAVEQVDDSSSAAVWVIRPGKLNAAVLGEVTIATQSHPALQEYLLGPEHMRAREVEGVDAVAVRPEFESQRIVAQRGGFTLHGRRPLGLESICEDLATRGNGNVPLAMLEIEPSAKRTILRELMAAGVSCSTIYPELQGIAQELKLRYSDAFIDPEDVENLN